MPRALYTLGHGTASQDELAALIRDAGLTTLVDVRAFPGSRRHPYVARAEMERWVPELTGSAYVWRQDLGGFRKPDANSPNVALRNSSFRAYADYMATPPFAAALEDVLELAARGRCAVMCSETLWWRCHRRLIADSATLLHACDVRHLLHDGTLHAHAPTAGARVLDGALRYDVLIASTTVHGGQRPFIAKP